MGPIGVLCIRRTLAHGRLTGFVSGLGAATADALYGSVAAFGLTLVAGFLASHQAWFRLVGGLFLAYLGVKTFLARPADGVAAAGGTHLRAGLMVCGVFLGSALWWFTLSGGVSLFRAKVAARHLQWVNRTAGMILLTFGLVAAFSLVRP